MEAAGSILEKEEWLDFLPTKTLEKNSLNVAAEVGIAIIKFLYKVRVRKLANSLTFAFLCWSN